MSNQKEYDDDKLVAATLAGHQCAAAGKIAIEDYLAAYTDLLSQLRKARADKSSSNALDYFRGKPGLFTGSPGTP